MRKIRDEVSEMLDLFDEFNASPDTQRDIIENGIVYDFAHGYEKTRFGCLEVAEFLKFCKLMNISVDVNEMANPLWDDDKYRELLKLFKETKKMSRGKIKSKKR